MGILISLIVALFIASMFSSGYRKSSSWGLLTMFFLIMFLAGIAGHYWIVPFGPTMHGISFLPILFFISVVAFLFSAPHPHCQTITKSDENTDNAIVAIVGISVFMWIVIVVFIAAGIAGHYR